MTNNLISNILLNSNTPTPEVGMGATIAMWTDRRAATIVEVIKFETGERAGQIEALVVQRDNAKRLDKYGMSDAQSYDYSPNPEAPRLTFTANKKGQFTARSGDKLIIGRRDEYFDYSF